MQVIRAALGRGVIECQRKIAPGGTGQPRLDDFPRGEPVRKRDDAEIVGQRGSQHGSAGEGRRQPGHHLHGDIRVALRQLQQRAGHAVHAGIAGADQRHSPPCPRRFQRPAAAVELFGHAGGIGFFFREKGAHKVQIDRIAAQHLGLLQGAPRLRGQKPRAARAKAHDENNVMVLHPSNSNPGQMVLRPAPA